MTTFTVGKSSHNKHDIKNASLAMKSRQQVINEVNKRRTLLQDNSWIKKRSEEESIDENYGKVVLNQYKSQDSLHRNLEGENDEKALLNRYRSDSTLDRIPGRSDANKTNTPSELDSRINKRSPKIKSIGEKNEGHQDLDDLIKVNRTSKWQDKGCDLDSLIAVKDNIEESLEMKANWQNEPGHQDLDDLIRVDQTSNKHDKTNSDLERFIAVKSKTVEGHQDLDDFIVVNCTFEQHDKRSQDLNDLIRVNHTSDQLRKDGRQDLDDLIKVNRTSNKQGTDCDLNSFIQVKGKSSQGASKQSCESESMPRNQSDMSHLSQVSGDASYYTSSSHSSSMDTIVYTRIYENSQLPHPAAEDCTSRRSIKTVYSTSDKAIIEKELCTYCRKPLGTDTKMILEALQICCHATCFKCEVCNASLENLKAGDSIWIYKNTVHCTPCYSKVKATWTY